MGTAFALLLWAALNVAPAWSADSAVYHYTGTVYSFDGRNITVGDKVFMLAKKCEFLRHYRKNKAFFEDKASSGDVRNGDSVSLHVNGNVIDKIIVEEWKR